MLNWTPLKPQQVKGTVFSDLDDDKLLNVIDFLEFEEVFKLGAGLIGAEEMKADSTMKKKRTESVSLMEPNRLRNVGEYSLQRVVPVQVSGRESSLAKESKCGQNINHT
jgi:hypothetical protein